MGPPPGAAPPARPLETPRAANHRRWRPPRARAGLLAALAVALAGCAGVALAVSGAGSGLATALPWVSRDPPLDVFWEAPDWVLTDQLERPVRSDELRGRVALANFVYTSCRETCPTLSARIQAVQECLRRERLLGPRVVLLSFSVDPARDTPDALRAYAERHGADHAAWRFLTGPDRYVLPLVNQGFRLGVQHVPAANSRDGGGYDTMHSNRFVLIDPQGRVRALYDGLALDPDRVVHDARRLLG